MIHLVQTSQACRRQLRTSNPSDHPASSWNQRGARISGLRVGTTSSEQGFVWCFVARARAGREMHANAPFMMMSKSIASARLLRRSAARLLADQLLRRATERARGIACPRRAHGAAQRVGTDDRPEHQAGILAAHGADVAAIQTCGGVRPCNQRRRRKRRGRYLNLRHAGVLRPAA
jgi:hypothetical protein